MSETNSPISVHRGQLLSDPVGWAPEQDERSLFSTTDALDIGERLNEVLPLVCLAQN